MMSTEKEKLTVVDLFAGAGGFSEGFRQKGFDVIFGLDHWEPATTTLKLNHPETKTETMDIRDIQTSEDIDRVIPDADVIIGGPPCVSFSHSNRAGKADKTEGLNLIEVMLRIIAWKKENGGLKYWALENVPNAKKHIKKKYTWEELQLPGSGSDLVVKKKPVHNSADFGVPQTRKRMICGNYPDLQKTHSEDEWITMRDVFDKLGDPMDGKDSEYIEDPCYELKIKKEELTDHYYDTRVEEYKWKRAKRLKEDHGYMGKMSFPEELDRPSRTVMATRSASARESMLFGVDTDGDGEYEDYRLPTVREIACFMSYPLTYQFEASTESKKYRLVGNSVPPKLSAAIAEAIAEKEGMETPDRYQDPDETEKPSLDLTGREREKKKPRKRRDNAKYARHIPYMKTNGFRTEIDNKESDFSEGDVIWSTVLHKGVGRNVDKAKPSMEEIEELMENEKVYEGFDANELGLDTFDWRGFKEDLKERFSGQLPGPDGYQEIYVHRGNGEKYGPNESLEQIKDIIDKHLPKEDFSEVKVLNDGEIDLEVNEVPIRIVAGLYACKYITKKINSKK